MSLASLNENSKEVKKMHFIVQREGDILSQIDYLQLLIFDNKASEFHAKLVEFIDGLEKQSLSANEIMKNLQSLLEAYEQGDYLLFADLLEYKVKELFEKQDGEEI